MVAPISAEILVRMSHKEPRINFLTGSSACRRDVRDALERCQERNKVSYEQRDFLGYEYDIPQKGEKTIARVFCGAKNINEPNSDVMLRVSIHPTDPEGVGAVELGSQEYILKYNKAIVVNEDDRGGLWIDGTKKEDLVILSKVQALAEEVTAKLDTLIVD